MEFCAVAGCCSALPETVKHHTKMAVSAAMTACTCMTACDVACLSSGSLLIGHVQEILLPSHCTTNNKHEHLVIPDT